LRISSSTEAEELGEDVVGAKGQGALLRALAPGHDLDDGIASGLITRQKVAGRWVYAASEAMLTEAADAVRDMAEELLGLWLLVPLRILAGAARKRIDHPEIAFEAAEPLLKRLVQNGNFLEVGMLTAEHAPYLALASRRDADELERQVEFMRERMLDGQVLYASDLPAPMRGRDQRAWQVSMLRHGEFLGLGATDGSGSQLVPWKRL
jgi:hypothetical protein